MDEQREAWRSLHQQRINRINSVKNYGNQYKFYLMGNFSINRLSIKEKSLEIYPIELIHWVERLAEIDGFYELVSWQIPLKEPYLYRFCRCFSRYYESLLYNKPLKRYIFSNKYDVLCTKMAVVLAEQCFGQEIIVVSKVFARDSFHYRLKQFVWLIANMIMFARQEGIMILSPDSHMVNYKTHDKMMKFLKYEVELMINGYRDSTIATRLELKYLEMLKDASNSVEDLKLAYFIKLAQQSFNYDSGDVLWKLCCDIGELSKDELKQLYSFLLATGIIKGEICSIK